jgi:hypothetical protein
MSLRTGATTNRKEELRKVRAEERKAKRHAKAEAKRARKANKAPAAKWTAERKAEIRAAVKEKKNQPKMLDRKRERLLQRAKNLEVQAAKLLAKSRQAAAQYQAMVDADKVGSERVIIPPPLHPPYTACSIETYTFDRRGARLRGSREKMRRRPTILLSRAMTMTIPTPHPRPAMILALPRMGVPPWPRFRFRRTSQLTRSS